MSAIWSDDTRLARWLEVELAALDGWAETGAVPRAAVDAIRVGATVPTPERVAELEARTHHDVAAFVDAVAEQLGEEGRWFHYGLTSSDVVDTALALQLREAGTLILDGLERALAAVTARAEEHRRTITIGAQSLVMCGLPGASIADIWCARDIQHRSGLPVHQ